jgi:HD-like signal output (HDOD) protein
MTQAAHEWVNLLSAEPLPVLRRTLTQVRHLLNSSCVNHARLSEIISMDPGFSLHLLQRLTALPNTPREPVNKIALAIPLLGMGLIDQASRTLPCLEDKLKGPARSGLLDCYSRGVHAAIYAGGIARLRGDQDEGTLYTATLLHDLGEMLFWSQQPDLMLQFRHRIRQGDGRDDAALEVLGCTLEEINVDLSEMWRLPELIRTAQGMANSYQPGPLCVMIASALARESSLGWMRSQTLDNLELLAEFLDLPIEQILSRLHRLSAEAARQLAALPYPLPAFHLISGADLTLPKAGRQAATGDIAPRTPARQSRPLTEQPAAGTSQVQPRATRAGKKDKPLQQIFTRALTEMRQGPGLRRAMFAMLNSDKSLLKARLVMEAPSDNPLKGFSVDLTVQTLFSMLLHKPQAIALTPRNIEKYRSSLPPQISATVSEKGFCVMSVFLYDKPVGIFYADNGHDTETTEQQYNSFKAICQRTIRSLG